MVSLLFSEAGGGGGYQAIHVFALVIILCCVDNHDIVVGWSSLYCYRSHLANPTCVQHLIVLVQRFY